LYDDCSETALRVALRDFDRIEPGISPLNLRRRAERFSEAAFDQAFRLALANSCSAAPARVVPKQQGSALPPAFTTKQCRERSFL
jgi:hypothetical protein